jgi:hypothetical protein
MLVEIYEEDSEQPVRSLKFDTPPKVGDHVALDGVMFQVKRAWHQPTDQWSAVTLAISLGPPSEPHPGFGGSWG